MEVLMIENLRENVFKNVIPNSQDEVAGVIKDFASLLNHVNVNYKKKLEKYAQKIKLDRYLQCILEKRTSLVAELEKLNGQIEQQQKEFELQEKKIAVSGKVVSLFRQHLALKIKKSRNGEISFIFSQIDKAHPDHCCVFNLLVEENVYKLTKCAPEVDDIEDMVSELNKTNDLSSFVINMRKKFCGLLSVDLKSKRNWNFLTIVEMLVCYLP